MPDPDTTVHTPAFEIRVRFHGLCPPGWLTLEDKPANIDEARILASQAAQECRGTIPAEVLVVGEWGPVDRWVDSRRARLESLVPGHPGGCSCGACCLRWQHLEAAPGHEPCAHQVCRLCDVCLDCDWEELHQRLQELAAARLADVGGSVDTALSQIWTARSALRDLARELAEADMDVDGVLQADRDAATAKLTRATEALEDVARIVELCQLRAPRPVVEVTP